MPLPTVMPRWRWQNAKTEGTICDGKPSLTQTDGALAGPRLRPDARAPDAPEEQQPGGGTPHHRNSMSGINGKKDGAGAVIAATRLTGARATPQPAPRDRSQDKSANALQRLSSVLGGCLEQGFSIGHGDADVGDQRPHRYRGGPRSAVVTLGVEAD